MFILRDHLGSSTVFGEVRFSVLFASYCVLCTKVARVFGLSFRFYLTFIYDTGAKSANSTYKKVDAS